MLETYMNEVQNFNVMSVVTVDAQTNTETIPDFQQRHNHHMLRLRERTSASTTSLRDPKIYPIDDRSLVKRSQTFSPSAVTTCNKSRYICRRSDSDSAMHFNLTTTVASQPQPHPFRRGAVERRSLRYHGKPPRLLSASEF
jgi:protein KIBRA